MLSLSVALFGHHVIIQLDREVQSIAYSSPSYRFYEWKHGSYNLEDELTFAPTAVTFASKEDTDG